MNQESVLMGQPAPDGEGAESQSADRPRVSARGTDIVHHNPARHLVSTVFQDHSIFP
jgi:hypothetical protein